MKRWVAEHREFSAVLVIEVVIILVMVIASFKKPVTWTFDGSQMTAVDDTAVIAADGSCHITGKDDGELLSRDILVSDDFFLPRGMYELTIQYESVSRADSNCDDYAGIVRIVSQKLRAGIQCSELLLHDTKTSVTDRLWVRSFNGIDDLKVRVSFEGIGSLCFSRIEIRELCLWRVICAIGWLLFFGMADFIYLYFFTNNSYTNKQVIISLGITIFFSSLPLFTDFLYWGHDMDFHTARIWSLAKGIQNGHWIVPIQTEMVNGHGYATPLFYSQLFLYLPAIIYCMGAPLQVCYQIYAFLINAASCLVCFYSVKRIFRNKSLAVFGAFLYTFSAYRLADVYTRASVGEYTAMVFLPLVLCGFVRVYTTEQNKLTWRDTMPIVIGLTGIIQCHILTCELTALCIVLFCIITIKKTLQQRRLFALIRAALLTMAVNAAFLIPFLSSLTMNLTVKANKVNQMQEHGTYLIQVFGIFMTATGGSVKGTESEMPLSIGFALIVGIGVVVFCRAKQYDWGIEKNPALRIGTFCAGFAVLSIIFSLRIMPWDSVQNISGVIAKVLCMIQYPWRYYAFATVFGVFATVAGIRVLSEYKGSVTVKLCFGAMIVLTVLNAGVFFMNYANEAKTITVYGAMPTEIGYGEYLPTGTVMNALKTRNLVTDESAVSVRAYQYESGVTSFVCSNSSNQEKTVGLPLLNYDHYHAYDMETNEELEIRNGQNNCVDVVIKPYFDGKIEVRYVMPALWKLAYLVSISTVGAMLITAVCSAVNKKKKERCV